MCVLGTSVNLGPCGMSEKSGVVSEVLPPSTEAVE